MYNLTEISFSSPTSLADTNILLLWARLFEILQLGESTHICHSLTYFAEPDALKVFPYCHKWQDFLFSFCGWIIFYFKYTHINTAAHTCFYPFVHQWEVHIPPAWVSWAHMKEVPRGFCHCMEVLPLTCSLCWLLWGYLILSTFEWYYQFEQAQPLGFNVSTLWLLPWLELSLLTASGSSVCSNTSHLFLGRMPTPWLTWFQTISLSFGTSYTPATFFSHFNTSHWVTIWCPSYCQFNF